MSDPTRSRGRTDTDLEVRAGAHLRAARPRILRIALLLALLVHAPLLPLRIFSWLHTWLEGGRIELAEMEGEAIVPVDLDLLEAGEAAAPAGPAPEPAPAAEAPATPAPKPKRPDPEGLDAGVDAADAGPDADEDEDAGPDAASPEAGTVDAGPDAEPPDAAVASTEPDAGIADADALDAAPPEVAATPPDAGPAPPVGPTVREPTGAAGGAGKIASKQANVQVLIASDRLRNHELGEEFGQLLTQIPQWRSFFSDTGLNPVRDFEHMLITGPQLRRSDKVVAVMDWNPKTMDEARARAAVNKIVARSSPRGEWLKDTPVPAAKASADGAPRLFAIVASKRILAVLPVEAKAQLSGLKDAKGFGKSSGPGLLVHMVTPHRAFRGLPVRIPDTLKWLRLSVTPKAGGGADVVIEAEDASAAEAREHARELTDQLELYRAPLGMPLFDPVKFSTSGATLRAKTHVSRSTLRLLLGLARAQTRR